MTRKRGPHENREENIARFQAQSQAHLHFDYIWQRGHMAREEAYGWLAKEMDIPRGLTHMALFTRQQCDRVVEIVKKWKADRKARKEDGRRLLRLRRVEGPGVQAKEGTHG